jgi:RHS repeat-associated protein
MRFLLIRLFLILAVLVSSLTFGGSHLNAQVQPRVAKWTLVAAQNIQNPITPGAPVYSWYRRTASQSTTFNTPEEVCQYVADWDQVRNEPNINFSAEKIENPKVISETFYNLGVYENNFPALKCIINVTSGTQNITPYTQYWFISPSCIDNSKIITQLIAGSTSEVDLYCGSTKIEIQAGKIKPGNYDIRGLTGVSSPPRKTVGDPVEVDTGVVTADETDYSSADGLIRVDRKYRNNPASWQGQVALNQSPGFGLYWRGLLPGKITACVTPNVTRLYYNFPSGGQVPFTTAPFDTRWVFTREHQGRLTMSMVVNPTQNPYDYFGVNGLTTVPNTVSDKELTLSFANGDQVFFRRTSNYNAQGCRTLVPVEKKQAGGYSQVYEYLNVSDEQPQKIRDVFNRQLQLTWADAGSVSTYLDGDFSAPGLAPTDKISQKNVSEILLPDGTKLKYQYDAQNTSGYLGRLKGVQRVSPTNTTLWARSYLYDDARFPLSMTGILDQNNARIATYAYDASGRAALAERASGYDKHTLTYDDVNNRRTITGPLNLNKIYQYAPEEGNLKAPPRALLSETTASAPNVTSAITEYTYDIFSRQIASFKNGNGNLSTQVSEFPPPNESPKQRPTSTTDANGVISLLEWHPSLDLVTKITRPGQTITYEYSTSGQLLRQRVQDTANIPNNSSYGQIRSVQYQWDNNGRLLSVARPDLNNLASWIEIARYTYSTTGNRLNAANALNQITNYAGYDVNGRPGTMTDPNGIVTAFTYDTLGHVTSLNVKHPTTAANDAITTFEYDVEGRIIGITRPATDKLIMDYDLAGRLTAVRATSGERIDYSYDAMGNALTTSVKRTNATQARAIQRSFDALGRIISETLGANRTTSWTYDKNNNIVKTTTARANVIDMGFDKLDRLVSVIAPAAGTTNMVYNERSDVTKVTDAVAVATQFVRNGFGEVVQEVSPDRGTSTYTYDIYGRVTSALESRGQQINFSYDALDRVTAKTPIGRPASEVVSYTWDAAAITGSYGIGRLSSITDNGTSVTRFKYDHRGNVLIKQQAIGTSNTANLTYAYNLADRITQITYPSGRLVGYVRDTKQRVTTVRTKATSATTAWTNIATGIQYEPFASLKQATLGNTLSMTNNWGNDGRLASRRLYVTSGGVNRSLLTYGYDNDDNITGITDGVTAANSLAYSYDAAGRLTRTVAQAGTYKREDLLYDANGNRTASERRANATDVTPAQTDSYLRTAGTNRLASITTVAGVRSITYDARGNTLSETRPSAITVSTSYDGYGRLLSYTRTGDAAQANVYNGLDERVAITSGAAVSRFVYDPGGRVIGEYGASANNVIAERIWMTPETNGGGLFGGDDGTGGYAPVAIVAVTTLSWVHGNHLGVPQVYTNTTGAVIATPAYTLPGFPGQFRTLADIYYNKYRDYDISTGRYIQADPIGLSGGTSPYLYANGNPVRYTDSSGLFLDTFADIGFIGYDIYRIVNDNVLGNGKGGSLGTNLGALGLDVGGALIPGVTGLGPASRVARKSEETVYRLGESAESASRLGRKSAEAESMIGQHGVSVSSTKPPAGTPCSSASCSNLAERGFEVIPTPSRNDPNHKTVLLPKPVTKEVAKGFNDAFGR